MDSKKPLHMIAVWLVIIGGLNWGLVGIGMLAGTNLNVVNLIFGSISWLEAVVYLLVGLAALMKLAMVFKKSA